MGNLIDYIEWRGDLSFDREPFNDIDALLLSEIVYTEVGGIVPGGVINDRISLCEIPSKYFELYERHEGNYLSSAVKAAPYLWEKAAESQRFRSVQVTGYLNMIDNKSHTQFAVMSFFLPDDTVYVAYRGTDDSITGWREDFSFSYKKETAGQAKAAKYLNRFFGKGSRRLRIGGHSKGGNFAIYAAMKCNESVRGRIMDIYAFDSPGFSKKITGTEVYRDTIKHVKSYVPEQSIVSLFFDSKTDDKVVKSSASGIRQHNPVTWQILGKDFVYVPELCNDSKLIDRAFNDWLEEKDQKTREIVINTAFNIIESGGATTLNDIFETGVSFKETARIIGDLDHNEQQTILDAFKTFAAAGGGTIRESFISKIKQNLSGMI